MRQTKWKAIPGYQIEYAKVGDPPGSILMIRPTGFNRIQLQKTETGNVILFGDTSEVARLFTEHGRPRVTQHLGGIGNSTYHNILTSLEKKYGVLRP